MNIVQAAADPNATPGTMKQNPFSMGSLSLVNTSSNSNSSTGLFGGGQMPPPGTNAMPGANAFGTSGNSTPTKLAGGNVQFGIGMSPNSFGAQQQPGGGDASMWQQQQQQRCVVYCCGLLLRILNVLLLEKFKLVLLSINNAKFVNL